MSFIIGWFFIVVAGMVLIVALIPIPTQRTDWSKALLIIGTCLAIGAVLLK